MRRRGAVLFTLACVFVFAAPAGAQEATVFFGPNDERAERTLLIHSSADIDAVAPLMTAFAERNPDLRIRYEQRSTNDIYQLAARACADGQASADMLLSSSIDQQVRLVNDGCAQPHRSRATEALPDWANWRDEVFGLTQEPAVIVYNARLIGADDVVRSRFDLIDLLRRRDGAGRARIATYDIERSGLGYLFAFADSQQAATFGRLIEAFGRNDVALHATSSALINGVARGDYVLAYNVLGSYALARARDDDRLRVVTPSDYTLVLSRAALVPKGAAQPDTAKALIDFALSADGQRLLAGRALILETGGPDAAEANLRPIAISPTLLVGLDQQKRRLFLAAWRSAIYAEAPRPAER